MDPVKEDPMPWSNIEFALLNLSHLLKASVFAMFKVIAMTTSVSHIKCNLMMEMMPKATHSTGSRYIPHQKNLESVALMRRVGSADSNTHILSPFELVSFHHLKPTSSRPETFLVVQKSAASSRMTMTKMRMKLLVKSRPKRYVSKAAALKTRKKRSATG